MNLHEAGTDAIGVSDLFGVLFESKPKTHSPRFLDDSDPVLMLSPIQIKILLESHAVWSYRSDEGFTRKAIIPHVGLQDWLQFLSGLKEVDQVRGSWGFTSGKKNCDIEICIFSPKFDNMTYAFWKIDTQIATLRSFR